MALLSLVLVLAATFAAYRYYFHPLRRIPGPLLAKFTDAQRFFDTAGGRAELTHRLLHAKYGPVVRIGPNTVSLSDPECIKLIYSNKANFPKVGRGLPSLHPTFRLEPCSLTRLAMRNKERLLRRERRDAGRPARLHPFRHS